MRITTELAAALAGRYVVEREIGRGGMAVVYLARDTKHDRLVAVKVLSPELGAALGAERFLSEIKTTATLQHPNLLPLFDSGEANGLLYYVMPYVEGESLRARLEREQQLPVEDAVRIATGIATALSYAHARGVIHRDLKPENVLLHHGQPVVLDFGIALAVRNAAEGRKTQTGISVGTPQYMSPEQAAGEKIIDARADIYALGTLTYEMLAGEPPHTGRSAQAIITKVMSGEVRPLTAVRPSVPAHVAGAVQRALARVPADRFPNAAEFARALENHPAAAALPAPVAAPSVPGAGIADVPARRTGGRHWNVALLVLAVAASGLATWALLRPPPSSPRRQLVINLPQLSRVGNPVIAPTGNAVAFVGDGRLWIRFLDELDARPLEGTAEATAPFWSPDGLHVAYFVGNRVFSVPARGGTPRLITSMDRACAREGVCGGAWADGGRILLSSGFAGVQEVDERGGAARPLVVPDTTEHLHGIAAVPGGRGAFVTVDPDSGANRIDVWDGTERRSLLANATVLQYVESGHLLFRRGDGIWALPLTRSLQASGAPWLVVDRASFASASRDGALVYVRKGDTFRQLAWVNRDGVTLEALGTDDGAASNPAPAPDGRRIAFTGRDGIHIHAPALGTRAALGSGDGRQDGAAWSRAADVIYYSAMRPGGRDQLDSRIRTMRPGGVPSTVVDSGYDPAISADGRLLTYTTGDVVDEDLWYRALLPTVGPRVPFLVGPGTAAALRISPDGRFAAFMAGDWATGKFEIYISRFPTGEDRTQVSSGGVRYWSRLAWSAAGDELYYVREGDGTLMAVPVSLGTTIRVSPPRALFSESGTGLDLDAGFAVSRDPNRFVAVRRSVPNGGTPTAVVLLDDWLQRVERGAAK